jgi:hypothetical protein
VARPLVPRPRRRRDEDRLVAFLDYLDDIALALAERQWMRLSTLLRKRIATHLPREVREELLMMSRLATGSLRAPVQFLRFQHRMSQLALGGESLPTAQTELALEPRAQDGAIRRPERLAASDSADDVDAGR